ncbi:MAG: DUF1292 domain-containing protein [Clostridia bacterium]|nr:DUF1292 domain-containing protein [Clostridia bacterium]
MVSNDNTEKSFDELVNQITELTQSEAETETDASAEATVSEDGAGDGSLDSPDSEYDGFEGANIVSLYDEEGNEFEFELLDYVDYNDKLYAVMIPAELSDAEDDQVAVIMETYFEGNEPNFIFVDDEELAQKVLDEFSAGSGE